MLEQSESIQAGYSGEVIVSWGVDSVNAVMYLVGEINRGLPISLCPLKQEPVQ